MPVHGHSFRLLWLRPAASVLLLVCLLVVLAIAAGHARQGALIAYVETYYGITSQIHLIDVDFRRAWTVGEATACQVDWTPDGSSVVLTHAPNGGLRQVMLMSLWRREARILTSGGYQNEAPSISPDGRWIVYAGNSGRANTLYLIDRQSGNSRPLAVVPLWVNATRWSPEGDYVIAEGVDSRRQPGAYTVDITSGTIEALAMSTGNDIPSPDGQRVAMIETDEDGDALRISETGGTAVTLVSGFRDIEVVAWSQDGSRIAFSAQPWETGQRLEPYDLYVIRRDGSGLNPIRRGISRFVSSGGSYINNVSHFCAVAWGP